MDDDERARRRRRDGEPADRDTYEARSQPELPFDRASSGARPGSGAPVDYVLTARARRAVAPDTLPDLTVLPGDGAISGVESDERDDASFDPHDPRPARARALRRSGRTVAAIAAVLKVDEDLAARWCEDVDPTRRRRRRAAPPRAGVEPRARAAAAAEARQRMGGAPEVALGAVGGLVSGLARITPGSVTVTPPDPELVPAVVAWLTGPGGATPDLIRVLVAGGPTVARDVAAQDWARRLELDREQVSHAPWAQAPAPDAIKVTVRVTASEVAARVAGWRTVLCDALDAVARRAEADGIAPTA